MAVGLAVLGCGLLLWGRSYPGFPVVVALAVLLCALGALLLSAVARGAVGVALVVVTSSVGVATAVVLGDRPLQARWSASTSDFESYVAQLPAPSTSAVSNDGAWLSSFPPTAGCPAQIGRFVLSECVALDGGYLFLQAPDAITDSSGIAYLPADHRLEGTGMNPRDLTPLGGPWWSWTCHC